MDKSYENMLETISSIFDSDRCNLRLKNADCNSALFQFFSHYSSIDCC